MNISPWIIYLWGTADGFKFLMTTAALLLCAASILFTMIRFSASSSDFSSGTYEHIVKLSRRLPFAMLFAGLIACITPSSQTIAVIVIAPAIVNSQPIQRDLPELYNIALESLKSSLKDKESLEAK